MDAAPKLAPEAQRPADTAQPSLELVPPSPPNPDRPPEQLLLIRTLELVQSIHAQQRDLAAGIRDLKLSLPVQRRPVSKRVLALQITATLLKRGGLCPCCQEVKIVDENGRLPGAEVDHWFSRDRAKAIQVWLVCRDCNLRLSTDTEFKSASRSAFESYQAALRPLLSRQATLGLAAKGE